jgi:23S rRNA (cytidine1920-2'-O)/16S rRNA (cytidine1409-2'-O)-methyltransferase
LDALLVDRQLLPDLKTAQAWIVAGDVLVDGRPCTKAGSQVAPESAVALRRPLEKYVSRGGLKLEGALRRFPVAVAGRVVLDAGASTGGFTDCLLQHGAARVFSVDVGFGQLRGKLATDPRVVNLERTNVGALTRETFDRPLDLAVFDLSYLSAKKAIPILAALFTGPVEMIGLIKPLFEGVEPAAMQDPAALRPALLSVVEALPAHGLAARDLMVSPILGSRGTVEFLAWIASGAADAPAEPLCDRAIAEVARTSFLPDGG